MSAMGAMREEEREKLHVGERTKTQASVDANEGNTAAADLLLQSPPCPLKRTQTVVKPEPDEVTTTSRKKAKTVPNIMADAAISVSMSAKGTQSKRLRGQGGDVDIDKGDEVSGKKCKQATVVADIEEVDKEELPEPKPKKKKKKENSSAAPQKPVQQNKKASTSGPKSSSKCQSK
ncbi:hypothetical protein BT96DRAFT_994011 [Gymnopus androsaceus JB14]|uniref:Uncharacterized protein n=1 Tax=Gymnopus androsaceus JB14 TaxID=1447944 RepID=A0A6A4HP18_9AGAR|nr:hypothetical protein BT96DRAFT_994011 [Gymnopus androsaceus JB14]